MQEKIGEPMDQEEWKELLGHLRDELISQRRDPGVCMEADREQKKICIRNDATDDSVWITFDMQSDFTGQDLRGLAVDMVRRALGSA